MKDKGGDNEHAQFFLKGGRIDEQKQQKKRRVARVVQAINNLWVDAVESQIRRTRRGLDGRSGEQRHKAPKKKKKGS